MKASLLKKFKMYLKVQAVLKKFTIIWSASANFSSDVSILDTNIEKINEKDQLSQSTTSISAEKEQALDAMLDATLDVCAPAKAYAAKIKGNGLFAKFDFSKSDLKKGNEKAVQKRCIDIYNEGILIKEKLIEFDMPANQLELLLQAVDAFDRLIAGPQKVRNTGKSAKAEMNELFNETDNMLEKSLDNMMYKYKKTNSDFFTEYDNARYIGGWRKGKEEDKGEEQKNE